LRKEITQKYNRYIKDIAENIEKIRKIHKNKQRSEDTYIMLLVR